MVEIVYTGIPDADVERPSLSVTEKTKRLLNEFGAPGHHRRSSEAVLTGGGDDTLPVPERKGSPHSGRHRAVEFSL